MIKLFVLCGNISKNFKKALIFLLLFSFLLINFTCTTTKWLDPTGKVSSRKIEVSSKLICKVIKQPTPEEPEVIFQLGTLPIVNEIQKKEYKVVKKGSPLGLLVLTGLGTALYFINWDSSKKRDDQNIMVEIGAWTGVISAGLLYYLWQQGVYSVSDTTLESKFFKFKNIKDYDEFKPVLGKHRISISTIPRTKIWDLKTENDGKFFLDLFEIKDKIPEGQNLKINLSLQEGIKYSEIIPSSFFYNLKNYLGNINPPLLSANAKFSDINSTFPNNLLDASEKAKLLITVQNRGEGNALKTCFIISNDNPFIEVPTNFLIGEIHTGELKTFEIPVSASLDATDGNVTITIQTKEKRGYDARPMKLKIPLRHLDRPKFELVKLEVNDSKVGLANGNGNGIPENGETIELIAFIKNVGVGKAIDATYKLTNYPPEIEIIQKKENLGTILPGQSIKAKAVFKIPETFTSYSLPLSVKIQDILNADILEEQKTFSMGVNLPVLSYQLNKPNMIHNGTDIKVEFISENVGKLAANNVKVQISSTDAVALSNNSLNFPIIKPGSKATPQVFTISIPRTYSKNSISLNIRMSQSNFGGLTAKETLPIEIWNPKLKMSEQLFDANQNNQIEQGEKIEITVRVSNRGKLRAENVKIKLRATDPRFNSEKLLGIIPSQSTQEVKFVFNIPWGFNPGAFPIDLEVTQDDFPAVKKTLAYQIVAGQSIVQTIEGQKTPEHTKTSPAVGALRNTPPNVVVLNLNENSVISETHFQVEINFSDDRQLSQARVRLNNRLIYNSQTDFTSQNQMQRSEGKLLFIKRQLPGLKIGENILDISAVDNASELTTKTISFQYQPGKRLAGNIILNPSIDIEKNIPQSKTKNPDGIAVILGIEKYKNIASATYARRDAAVFREYAINVLGIPDDRSHLYFKTDAEVTFGEFRKLFTAGGWLSKRVKTNSDIYIYYTGHGAPETKSKTPYLIPYDGDINYPAQTGFSLNQLYDELSKLNVRSVTVFLDACFSGLTRENELLLADSRPVAVKVENPILNSGKVTAFSSSSGSQSSNGYPNKQHGLFTYYLLKGLGGEADKNQDKNITVGELESYVIRHVKNTALTLDREQTPQVIGINKDKVLIKY